MELSLNRLVRPVPLAALFSCILGVAGTALAEYPSFSVSGDARVRYETIDIDPGDDVSRERYRARLALESKLSESFSVNVRLATGTGDPTSTNLNFGESFTADDIQLDRAWLTWRVSDVTRLHGGRMKNPLYRPGDTSLQWDSDLNPEGLAAAFRRDAAYATLGVFQLADQGDEHSRLFALQAGNEWRAGAGTLSAGVGYYDYTNTRGERPFFVGRAAGNSVDADGNYLHDYDIVELYVEYGITMSGVPVGFFGDWARNLEADRENRAWAVGINVGAADQRGGMAVSWAWHDTAADALIGTFTESDLGGGNTDSRGHLFGVEYALTDHLTVGGTLILSEFGHFRDDVREFDRVMLDLVFSF